MIGILEALSPKLQKSLYFKSHIRLLTLILSATSKQIQGHCQKIEDQMYLS